MTAIKRVTMRVYGHGSEFFPGGEDRIVAEVPAEASVNEILDALKVNRSLVMFVIAGGVRQGKDYVPEDGEEIAIVSPPSGG